VPPAPRRLQNLVHGSWVDATAPGVLEVPNPSDGSLLAYVPLSNALDVDSAVRSARSAAPGWREVPVAERARIVRRFVVALERDAEGLARQISEENGKTLGDARGSVRRGIEAAEFAVSAPTLLQGDALPDVARGIDSQVVLTPVGVVAGITPFNFPAMVPLWMAPLAIVCGNCFLLKPSERVPLTAEWIARRFSECDLPPGVLNLVHGDRGAVESILDHPGIDAVAFVGSAPAARAVYTRGTAHGKRVLALAGAKNHVIVLPDAVLDRTVEALIASAFGAAGERCLAASVVVAVEPVGDRLVGLLAERVRALRTGPPSDPTTEVGPLIRAEHRARVEAYLAAGVSDGAVLVARGPPAPPSGGFYFAPALFDHVLPTMRIAREEIFGPILSVIRVPDLDSALAVANGSEFGNAAAIFTADGRAAREFSRRIEAGMVGINIGVPAPAAYFPFVGWKGSVYGVGAATGSAAVSFYTRTKVLTSRWF
jgi:malonate-semialdehyde dehydrogenase (acetylating)/methylmalonate-semialdehyde dehydrogenase